MASFSLFGNVMSMASVQLVGANRDALLLSFKDAKVPLSPQSAAFISKLKLLRTDILVVFIVSPVVCGGI